MSKAKTYFSLFQENDYLETGKNSTSKKEAVLAGIDYVSIDSTAPSRLKRMSLTDKETYLENMGIVVDEHQEKLEDDFSDGVAGTQRSPFGIGS